MAGGFALIYYKGNVFVIQSKGSRYPIGTRALKSGVRWGSQGAPFQDEPGVSSCRIDISGL